MVEGEVNKGGMVLDFNELKKIVEEKILKLLDHENLNNLFEKPTAEKVAEWIFKELEGEISLHSVKLGEGQGKWVLIEKND